MLPVSPAPPIVQIDALASVTLAILLFFIGKATAARFDVLQRYGIPESVIGGVLCALLCSLLYYAAGIEIDFSLGLRDVLLLYFFAALGLNSSIGQLFSGGRLLVLLVLLSCAFMLIQNLAGMGLASLFGMDHRAGLMVGSIALTGGVGTTLAWAPYFNDTLQIHGATDLGLVTNMVGLVSACVIGGPMASWLIRRHAIPASANANVELGTLHGDHSRDRLDYHGVLLALFWLNVALMLGQLISNALGHTGLNLPGFVGCLLAGIALRSCGDVLGRRHAELWNLPSMRPGIALVSDICLGLFLTMALMGLKLWQLQPLLGFISVAMLVQVGLVVLFTVLVVFRAMGGNYEAAVVCAGFGGITLGSTATAVANMGAVTRQYGAAPLAFLIVPLVCGFFIDLANALLIGWLLR